MARHSPSIATFRKPYSWTLKFTFNEHKYFNLCPMILISFWKEFSPDQKALYFSDSFQNMYINGNNFFGSQIRIQRHFENDPTARERQATNTAEDDSPVLAQNRSIDNSQSQIHPNPHFNPCLPTIFSTLHNWGSVSFGCLPWWSTC